jgi:uncharacterized protein (TIGR02611 family)
MRRWTSWYHKLPRLPDTPVWNFVRRAFVLVFGTLVLLVGIAMIVLPGPAIVVIPLGLAILATEFLWARRLLLSARIRARKLRLHRVLRSTERTDSEALRRRRSA